MVLSKNDVKFWFSNVLKEGFSSSINNNFMKFSELGINNSYVHMFLIMLILKMTLKPYHPI